MFADLNPNIEIRANFRHVDGFFPDAWDVNLYRIIQEAVSNTMKYARATAVELSDDLIGERLLVRIRDDGQGFSRTCSNGDGIGLFVMQERAQMLGGDLRINSIKAPAINHGTEVQIDIPRQHQNAQ
jgi:two-component system sensor histidine kinase NreB